MCNDCLTSSGVCVYQFHQDMYEHKTKEKINQKTKLHLCDVKAQMKKHELSKISAQVRFLIKVLKTEYSHGLRFLLISSLITLNNGPSICVM